ncbi:hypothetical protein M3624_29535, partial [Priestia megaterium]|nr:hypothetical protein [Priestia megaterium]
GLTCVAIILFLATYGSPLAPETVMPFPSRFAARLGRSLLVAACVLACGASVAAEPLSGTLEKIRQANLISIGHRET